MLTSVSAMEMAGSLIVTWIRLRRQVLGLGMVTRPRRWITWGLIKVSGVSDICFMIDEQSINLATRTVDVRFIIFAPFYKITVRWKRFDSISQKTQ